MGDWRTVENLTETQDLEEEHTAYASYSSWAYISHAVMSNIGTARRRWEDNIKIDLQELGWEGMDWIFLAQDRDRWREVVNAIIYLRVP